MPTSHDVVGLDDAGGRQGAMGVGGQAVVHFGMDKGVDHTGATVFHRHQAVVAGVGLQAQDVVPEGDSQSAGVQREYFGDELCGHQTGEESEDTHPTVLADLGGQRHQQRPQCSL
jgi:hypothetical protein